MGSCCQHPIANVRTKIGSIVSASLMFVIEQSVVNNQTTFIVFGHRKYNFIKKNYFGDIATKKVFEQTIMIINYNFNCQNEYTTQELFVQFICCVPCCDQKALSRCNWYNNC